MQLDPKGLEAAIRECARITAPNVTDEIFAEARDSNSKRYQNTQSEISRIIRAYLEAAPANPAQVTDADLDYGLKLIAEAIEEHFGDRDDAYKYEIGDTTIHDVWEAYDALTTAIGAGEQAVAVKPLELFARPAALSGSGAGGWRTKASDDVLAERKRQVEAEGWTPEHDDGHDKGEMALAAACYVLASNWSRAAADFIARYWPWDRSWWKPSSRRRDLVKAGALIFAEIDRLDRLAASPAVQGGDYGE